MPTEEPLMRAREVLERTLAKHDRPNSAGKVRVGRFASQVVITADHALEAMLAFADEVSGIGELRTKATALIEAYDDAKDEGGYVLWQKVDCAAEELRASLAASLAASISSGEQIAENANCSPETSLRKAQRTALARLLGASRLRAKTATERQWADLLAAALDVCIAFEHPDIDRSGIAQEVG